MKYNKIYLFGGPGFGKTTIAEKLSADLGYKLISLDEIMFENGHKVEEKTMIRKLKRAIRNESVWLVEGGCLGWSDFLFKEADLVIMLKVSPITALFRILKRYLHNKKFGFRSTLKLCFKTLPAYFDKKVAEYPYKARAKKVIET